MAYAIPANYGLVMGTVGVSMVAHHIVMAFGVSKARKTYGIKYPALYASSDSCKNEVAITKFNCVQRGHQNCLENQPAFLATLMCAGLKHPKAASVLGLVYLVGKLLYFYGYSTGEPNNRLRGGPVYLVGQLGLLGICLKYGFMSLRALILA